MDRYRSAAGTGWIFSIFHILCAKISFLFLQEKIWIQKILGIMERRADYVVY